MPSVVVPSQACTLEFHLRNNMLDFEFSRLKYIIPMMTFRVHAWAGVTTRSIIISKTTLSLTLKMQYSAQRKMPHAA